MEFSSSSRSSLILRRSLHFHNSANISIRHNFTTILRPFDNPATFFFSIFLLNFSTVQFFWKITSRKTTRRNISSSFCDCKISFNWKTLFLLWQKKNEKKGRSCREKYVGIYNIEIQFNRILSALESAVTAELAQSQHLWHIRRDREFRNESPLPIHAHVHVYIHLKG